MARLRLSHGGHRHTFPPFTSESLVLDRLLIGAAVGTVFSPLSLAFSECLEDHVALLGTARSPRHSATFLVLLLPSLSVSRLTCDLRSTPSSWVFAEIMLFRQSENTLIKTNM